MKKLISLLAFCCFMLTGCDDDLVFPPSPINLSCDYELGIYKLAPTSLGKLPYHKTHVVYIDSLGQELLFRIIGNHYPSYKVSYAQYRGEDYSLYCFTTEYQTYTYTSEASETELYVSLSAKPVFVHPFNNNVEDELLVLVSLPDADSNAFTPIFRKVIDQRTAPEETNNLIVLPEFNCFGRTFNNVEYAVAGMNETIYFNLTEGIVSFRDEHGKRWCFDRFE